MNTTVISAMIFGIIQINVHATLASAHATNLKNVNEDVVLDPSSNIEWTKDANLAKTLCDNQHILWQSFDPTSVDKGTGRSASTICEQGGKMNWYEAKAWISHLNVHHFLGYSDWRMPQINQHDSTCSMQINLSPSDKAIGVGQGCMNSEISHLMHDSLNNPRNKLGRCSQNSCPTDTGPFYNIPQDLYWSDTEIVADSSLVGVFSAQGDWQDAEEKTSDLLHVWPIRKP